MGSMMDMELRHGPKEADTVDSTGRASGMDSECIGFTPEMFTPENGPTGRAMGVEFIPAMMGADSSGNSSGVSNMGLAITISGI